jgi:LssY C-terminus
MLGAVPSNLPVSAHVRLLDPLSSVHSNPGTPFRAVVIAPVTRQGRILMPPGTVLSGQVTSRKAVGLGLINERASLTLSFEDYLLPDGRQFPLQARLKQIENGREFVRPDGQIRGVLAADSPQEVLGGIWTRPTLTLLQRSLVGLTGASGRIWASYSLGPVGAAGLFAVRCALFHMPEPNIQLPTGAELKLKILSVPANAPDFDPVEDAQVPEDLQEFLRSRPFHLTKANGRPIRDIVNFAFEGSQGDLLQSFRAAGWTLAIPLTAKSFTSEYNAFVEKTGFSQAPASLVLYGNRAPDFVFQKSLSDITLRHHVRVWKVDYAGRELWLGAATRDIGLGFNPRTMLFTHRIEAQIDWERRKIVNDLVFASCADRPGYVDRPEAAQVSVDSKGIDTDGRVAFLPLHSCDNLAAQEGPDQPPPVGSLLERVARRMVLETRQYVERENTFFWTYRAIKWTRAARRGSIRED